MNCLDGIKDARKKIHYHDRRQLVEGVKGFRCDKINVVQVLDTHACEWRKKPLRPLPVWLSVIKPHQEVLQRWIRDIWEESFNLKINKDRHIGQ